MALAFGARVALGMRTQLDGDEAAQAIAGVNLLHGHVVVTEPLAHYLGPFDAYVLAPFLAVGGHTLIAVRVALAVVGAAFSLAMYGLGRALFQRHRPALLLAAVAAVFPLFTVFWSAKAHETSEMLVLEATILALVICIGWRGRTHPAWWVALGAASGVALWANEESLAFLALAVLVLLMRSGALGFRKALEGMALAAVSFAVAFSPWLYHNLRTDFAALQSIPRIPATVATRFVALASSQVPILVGGSRACNQDVVPEPVTVALAIAVTLVLLWLRRKSLWHVVHGRFRDVEAADLTLLAAPLTIALLFAGGAEVLPCQPRYLIPLGIPMAVAVTLILITRSAWRIPVAMCAAAWLVVSG
ncbi:MAG: glycosyltransferase family 39 protein, partial [Candidatus Dormibacteraeota bacterium]|nr:glycosyltransferase family 39 protein [Candidatus Dormibacteraeota bacterium]